MNRRGFFGVLLGMAAAPVLSNLRMVGAMELVEDPIILPRLDGLGAVYGFSAYGTADESTAAWARMLRANGAGIGTWNFNGFGGALAVDLFPNPIIFTPDHPIVLDVSKDTATSLVYKLDGVGAHRMIINQGRVTFNGPTSLQ